MKSSVMELKEIERGLLLLNVALRKKLALAKGISLDCAECQEPLTGRELQDAIDENIKRPVCEDCLADFTLRKQIDKQDETTSPGFVDDSGQL